MTTPYEAYQAAMAAADAERRLRRLLRRHRSRQEASMTTLDHIDYEPEGTLVLVESVQPYDPSSTVIVFDGLDNLTGDTITFAVDHRPAQAIIAALDNDEEILLDLPDWAIIRRN